MNRAAAFLVGAGCALLVLTPVALAFALAALHSLHREADIRAAQALMLQIAPGITDCAHEGRTMNCTHLARGKARQVVLAVPNP